MAKRFVDTKLWDKAWFRRLEPKYKAVWFYIIGRCDHAGILDEDWEAAEFFIGDKITYDELPKVIKDKIIVIKGKRQYYIPSFIDFQYGELKENSKPHLSVIKRLKSKGLYNSLEKNKKSIHTIKDKDKNKTKVKDKVKDNKAKPNDLTEVVEYFKLKNIPDVELNAEKFYNHYESKGWYRGKTKIKNWKLCLSAWDFKKEEINNGSLESKYQMLKSGIGFKAYCTKCGKKEMPNKWQIKDGSSCCRVEYSPEPII